MDIFFFLFEKGLLFISSKEDVILFLFLDDFKYIEEFNKSWDYIFNRGYNGGGLDFWVDRIEVGWVGYEDSIEFFFDFFWYLIISVIMIMDIMISLEYC